MRLTDQRSSNDGCGVRPCAMAVVAILSLCGCSADEESKVSADAKQGEHILKDKTDTIDKARDVGRVLGEAAARQAEAAKKATQ